MLYRKANLPLLAVSCPLRENLCLYIDHGRNNSTFFRPMYFITKLIDAFLLLRPYIHFNDSMDDNLLFYISRRERHNARLFFFFSSSFLFYFCYFSVVLFALLVGLLLRVVVLESCVDENITYIRRWHRFFFEH